MTHRLWVEKFHTLSHFPLMQISLKNYLIARPVLEKHNNEMICLLCTTVQEKQASKKIKRQAKEYLGELILEHTHDIEGR